MRALIFAIVAGNIASEALCGVISGTAYDLRGRVIKNVIVDIRDEDGRRVRRERFDTGTYHIPINNNAVTDKTDSLTVVFSAVGRQPVQVNLRSLEENKFSVVMPERKIATSYDDQGYIPCKPKQYEYPPRRYYQCPQPHYYYECPPACERW